MESIETSTAKIQDALSARIEEIDGVICTGYTPTVAAATILSEWNQTPDNKRIHFVGIDTDSVVLDAIRQGAIDATISQNPYGHGYITCALLSYLLDGWQVNPDRYFINSGTVLVTKDNVDTFEGEVRAITARIMGELETKYLSPTSLIRARTAIHQQALPRRPGTGRCVAVVPAGPDPRPSRRKRRWQEHSAQNCHWDISAPTPGGCSSTVRRCACAIAATVSTAALASVHQEIQVVAEASVAREHHARQVRRLQPVGPPRLAAAGRSGAGCDGSGRAGHRPASAHWGDLSAAHKQLVQIARVLSAEARVLLLDEPTSSLTEHEAARLFGILRQLQEAGVAIVFVSHKFDEVYQIGDQVSVLRDGRHVGTRELAGLPRAELIEMMIGRRAETASFGMSVVDRTREVLRVDGLYASGQAHDVSFSLYAGEILGLYGLVGAGRTELARLLVGAEQAERGAVYIHGAKARIGSVADSLYKYSMGYVTENRKGRGPAAGISRADQSRHYHMGADRRQVHPPD